MEYEQLKEEVKQLKVDRKDLLRAQQARKAVIESRSSIDECACIVLQLTERALAEVRYEYEEEIRSRDREIARLKKHLNDSTQRESRHRSRLEK